MLDTVLADKPAIKFAMLKAHDSKPVLMLKPDCLIAPESEKFEDKI